ncbi:hypothetical protein AAVH_32184 [Aphelenchoides avenae]|nr:hypothetical protein AAVH_32184 [Aphelenchus avenae]
MTITRRDENAAEVRCFICDERLSLTNTSADLSDVLRHTHSPRHQQLMRENDSMLAESGRGRTSPQPSGSGLRGLISSRERYRPNNESMQGNRWHSLRGSPPPYRPSWFPLRSGGAESANNEAARYADEWDETASVPRRATQRVRFAYPRLGDPVEYVSMAPNVELGITAERSTTGNLESRGGNGQPGNGSQWDVTSVSHGTSPTDHAASPELGAFGLADLTAELRSNVVNSENDNEHSVNDIDWDGEWGEPRREPGPRNYFDSVDLNVGLISFEDVSNAENIENPGDQPNDTVGSATGPIVDFSEDDTGDYRDYSSDVDSIVADAGRVNDNAANAGEQPWTDSNPASEPPQHGFFHPQIESDDVWYTAQSDPVAVQNSEANESNDSLSEFLRSEEEPVNREASGVGAGQQNATEQGIGRAMRPEALIAEIASLFENSPAERDRGRETSDTASNAANVDFDQLFGQSSGAQARAHPTENDARDDSTDRATIIDAFLPSRNGNGSSGAPYTRQPTRGRRNEKPSVQKRLQLW